MFKRLVKKAKDVSLPNKIFIALILGVIAGITFGTNMLQFEFIGRIWINLIKMILVPLILLTVMSSITSQKNVMALGRMSVKLLIYFMMTTLMAVIIAIITGKILEPGVGFNLAIADETVMKVPDVTVVGFIKDLVSDNMFSSFTSANMIQIIVIAILLGIAVLKMKDENKQDYMITMINNMTDLVFSFMWMVINLSPIGVFFLMGGAIGGYGVELLGPFSKLIGTFYVVVLLQLFIVYGAVLLYYGRMSPFKFVKDSMESWIFTASTTSSVASIPVNIRVAEEKFGVSKRISNFVIPLGSQLNSDGNGIMNALVVIFAGQLLGIEFSLSTIVQIALLSTLITLGAGGIPGGGIIKCLIMIQAFGLPIEIGGMIAAFWRLFDMGTTTINCLGDIVGSIMIDKTEQKYSMDKDENISTLGISS